MICEYSEYNGTTTRSGYIRGNEHLRDIREKKEDSDLWKHCEEKHEGQITTFRMEITETFRRDPLLRQINEAVRISRTPEERTINQKEEYNAARSLMSYIYLDSKLRFI